MNKINFKRFNLLLSVLISLIFGSCAQHKIKRTAADRLQEGITETKISALMDEYKAVGLAVAVVKDNELIYTKSFGWKDKDAKIPLAKNDIFRIASISKSFTTTGLMQLVEAGKLSLEDDFSELVGFKIRNPHFPDKKITLKMILSHTSSINDREGYFNLDAINPAKNPNWENCYNTYEPGTDYQYCNLNFNMAGAVLEKYSGERFDQYIENHILKPLNLYGGYAVHDLDATLFSTIYSYQSKTQSFIPSPGAYANRSKEMKDYELAYSTPVFSPTGGMKMSAADLAKYMMMHMNYGTGNGKQIISEKSAKAMQTSVNKKADYGLSLRTIDFLIPGKSLIGHTGSAYGLYSSMFFDPKDKFGIVVITNGCLPSKDEDFVDFLGESTRVLYENLIVK